MMNEREFAEFDALYMTAVRRIKDYQARRNVGLARTPIARFYRPARALYRELSRRAGLTPPLVNVEHLRQHRLSDYGPSCKTCGLPLRTPTASSVQLVERDAMPNTRLKLSAPVRNNFGWNLEVRCCRLSFVNTSAWRRSLSAIR